MIELSDHQYSAVDKVLDIIANPREVAVLGGFAGTGKTTILKYIAEYIQERTGSIPLVTSLTGKAVLRIKEVTGISGSTLHSLMYTPRLSPTGQIVGWDKRKGIPPMPVLVDEASMLSEDLYEDIVEFTHENDCSILFVGDPFQLPPITGKFNIMKDPTATLSEIHRQADGPIIRASMKLRGYVKDLSEFETISKKDAIAFMRDNIDDTAYLCMSNRNRVLWNTLFKKFTQGEDKVSEIVVGDRLMVLKNNKNLNVFNGQVLHVQEIVSDHANFCNIIFQERPYETMVVSKTCLHVEKPEVDKISTKGENIVYADFGWALTCHKAQGSQYKNVIIVEDPTWMSKKDKDMYYRWLYTAITRATDNVILVR